MPFQNTHLVISDLNIQELLVISLYIICPWMFINILFVAHPLHKMLQLLGRKFF